MARWVNWSKGQEALGEPARVVGQAVCDLQAGGGRGVQESAGEPGRAGGGWVHDRGVRVRSAEQIGKADRCPAGRGRTPGASGQDQGGSWAIPSASARPGVGKESATASSRLSLTQCTTMSSQYRSKGRPGNSRTIHRSKA